jgi:hypothetical protein
MHLQRHEPAEHRVPGDRRLHHFLVEFVFVELVFVVVQLAVVLVKLTVFLVEFVFILVKLAVFLLQFVCLMLAAGQCATSIVSDRRPVS